MEKELMSESDLKNQIQFWWSKYCNSCYRPERELYLKIYTSMNDIYDLWKRENRFSEK